MEDREAGGRGTTPRTVHFYRVANEVRQVDGAMRRFDPGPLCAAVAGLGDRRYMVADDGSEVAAWLDRAEDNERLVLARIKRRDLPLKETRGGDRSVLELLEEEGIAEIIHILFLPNNVVGADFNFSGPRPTKLRDYVQDRFPNGCGSFCMAPIVDRSELERLARIERVKTLEITLSGHTLANLPERQDGNYIQTLRRLPAMGEAGAVTVIWKPEHRNGFLDSPRIRALVIHLLQNHVGSDSASRIVLKGLNADGGREEFNLLRDVILSRQNIVKLNRSRAVDSRDAFRAIGEAYNGIRDRLPPQLFLD